METANASQEKHEKNERSERDEKKGSSNGRGDGDGDEVREGRLIRQKEKHDYAMMET